MMTDVQIPPRIVTPPTVTIATLDRDLFSSHGAYIIGIKPMEPLGDACVSRPLNSGYCGYAVPVGDTGVLIYVPSVPYFNKQVAERLR